MCSSYVLVTRTIRFHGPFILLVNAIPMIFKLYVEIHLVSSERLLVGTRAGLVRSALFQTLLFGLFNVDSDYFMLTLIVYSGTHLMISHSFPVVEQVSLVYLLSLVMLFCFCIMLFIEDFFSYYLVTVELSSEYNRLDFFRFNIIV